MALAADWDGLLSMPSKASAWLLLATTAAVPVLYSRRIVDWGQAC